MHKNKGQGQSQGQEHSKGPNKLPGKNVSASPGMAVPHIDGKQQDGTDGKMEVELKPLSEMKIIGIRTPQMTQGDRLLNSPLPLQYPLTSCPLHRCAPVYINLLV